LVSKIARGHLEKYSLAGDDRRLRARRGRFVGPGL
jgi:hypothetical protein